MNKIAHVTLTILRLKLQRLMRGVNVVNLKCVKITFPQYDLYLIALICSLIVCFIKKLQFKIHCSV